MSEMQSCFAITRERACSKSRPSNQTLDERSPHGANARSYGGVLKFAIVLRGGVVFSKGVCVMADQEAHSSANNDKRENTFNAKKLATDRVPIATAHWLIDNYILEIWQEPPPSPALQPTNGDQAPACGQADHAHDGSIKSPSVWGLE